MQEQMVGQNIIITERLSALRQLGRNALRGKWKSATVAIMIVIMCVYLPALILNEIIGYKAGNYLLNWGPFKLYYESHPEAYTQYSNDLSSFSPLASLYILLIAGAFMLGVSLFFLASFRGHDVASKDVFLGFERFGKALGLMLFQSLFVFLWSCLFLIPGIIAAIRYSQAFFILADDPEKPIRQCMDESKAMMRGNKAKYFLLNLSFIGWILLASIPAGLISGIAQTMSDSPAVGICVSVIGYLLLAPVYAYMYSTVAGFYEILAGHLIKETVPMPITADQIDVEAPVEEIEEVIESEEEAEKLSEEPEKLVENTENPDEIVDETKNGEDE